MSEALAVPTDTTQTTALPRSIGALSLAFIFIAFNAPLAVLAGYLQPAIAFGNGIGAPVAFIAAGVLLLAFQIGCLAMSRHMKSPGAFYCYIAEGLGKGPALAGSILAALAYILFAVSGYVFLGLVTVSMLDQLIGHHLLPWQGWGLVGFAIVTVLNILRVDLSAKVVAICVSLEIVIVAIYEAVVMATGGPEGYSVSSFSPHEFLSGNPGLAILFALNTMIGIEAMAVYREETKDPNRTVPRASYAAITFTTIFFALAAYTYIIAIGPSQVIDDARNAPVDSVIGTFQHYLGSFLPALVSVLLVTSQLAAANSVQGASVRYLYSFGQDRVLPRSLGKVHPRLGSPYVAVAASILACLVIYVGLIAFSDDVVPIYGAMGGFGTLALLPLFLGTCAAIIVFFRRNPGLESPWKTLVAPAVAFIGFLLVVIFALLHLDLMVVTKSAGVVCALLIVALIAGGMAGAHWFKVHRPETYSRLGRQGEHLS